MTNSRILLPVFLVLTLLTISSLNIPFFWDSTFFSALSVHFFDDGINGFIAPIYSDTGGFPLYSIYLTFVWKCFGKSLASSHFAILPFMIGIAFEFFKLAKRFLNQKMVVYAMILLIIEPVFLTQFMIMGYDILILYFFLLSLNLLYKKNSLTYAIALILLCLISIRGIMLTAALLILDILINKKIDFNFLKKYIPSLIILLAWGIYHKHQTGWYIFSPIRENNHEQFSSITMLIRQLLYVFWKNIDIGRITLWLVYFFGGYYLLKNHKTTQYLELKRIVFIPLFVLTFFMILINNPIGHKYFLVVFILLDIAVCYVLQEIKLNKIKFLLSILIPISLLAGNFIVYPQRYGNAWDSSLKIIPFFHLEKEMNNYINDSKISSYSIGTQFPLPNDSLKNDLRFSYLTDSSYHFIDIENNHISQYHYFLYSNIINTNRRNDLEEIKRNWVIEKKLKKGVIELTLYRNPNF